MVERPLVAVPVYLNEATISALPDRFRSLTAEHADVDGEFVFVDDGSGDEPWSTIDRAARR